MRSYAWTAISNLIKKIKNKYSCSNFVDVLPIEIVELIYHRLDLASRLRFRAVCRSWRDAYVTALATTTAPDQLVKEPPWILLDISKSLATSPTYNLLDLSIGNHYKLDQTIFGDAHIYGSRDTFVIFSSGGRLSLYDVFSGEHIFLPMLDKMGDYPPILYNFAISCNPSKHINKGKCMVALASFYNNHTYIYLCRPGVDSKWRTILCFDSIVNGLCFHKDKLYGINVAQDLIFCLMPIYPMALNGILLGKYYFHVQYPELNSPKFKSYVKGNDYLVESDGELLVVRRLDDFYCDPGKVTVHFQVFKFLVESFEYGEAGLAKVVPIENIGERMLFVSARGSISWSSTTPAQISQHHSNFFKSNCIYFFCKPKATEYGFARYDLQNGNVCKAVLPSFGHPFHSFVEPSWITPPLYH